MRSLAEIYPELVKEWSEKNLPLTPKDVSYGSNKKVFWLGGCGHEWQATVKNRGNGSGCPYCSGNRVLQGFNDLDTLQPELVKEWSDRNMPFSPDQVTANSPRNVWWKCSHCGYIWQARIADRTAGRGCPACKGAKLVPGINDFASEHPELAVEWSEKNRGHPSQEWTRSRENVWWKCGGCGYEWRAVIHSRVNGQGCPVCAGRLLQTGKNDLSTLYPELAAEWDQEKNGVLMPEMIRAAASCVVYWKCKNGHSWKGKISDRKDGQKCPVCRSNEQEELKRKAVLYYAAREKLVCHYQDDSEIGIPIEFYFPQKRAAVEFWEPVHFQGKENRRENAKNWLCFNAGIRMVRIISKDTEKFDNCICIRVENEATEGLEVALRKAFRLCGIEADVDIKRDEEEIRKIDLI